MIRRPPRSTLFPTRRSSDLGLAAARREVSASAAARTAGFVHFRNHSGFQQSARRGVRDGVRAFVRSEEQTSELQSQSNLVCRLLLEKKKKTKMYKKMHTLRQ